jgi:hypothetical protein
MLYDPTYVYHARQALCGVSGVSSHIWLSPEAPKQSENTDEAEE